LNPKQLEFRPLEVSVQENDVGRALSALKRKMANEGLYKELKKRRFHEKPSVRRKRKQREADRRRKKLVVASQTR
jgi:small subunit ribosomal protein S21